MRIGVVRGLDIAPLLAAVIAVVMAAVALCLVGATRAPGAPLPRS